MRLGFICQKLRIRLLKKPAWKAFQRNLKKDANQSSASNCRMAYEKIIENGENKKINLEIKQLESENEKTLAAGGEPASASQTVLGITRRSLYTESWLSAASFEQTTDVLTDSSLMAREDKLLGLKENVIIGRLIPVTPEKAMLTN